MTAQELATNYLRVFERRRQVLSQRRSISVLNGVWKKLSTARTYLDSNIFKPSPMKFAHKQNHTTRVNSHQNIAISEAL